VPFGLPVYRGESGKNQQEEAKQLPEAVASETRRLLRGRAEEGSDRRTGSDPGDIAVLVRTNDQACTMQEVPRGEEPAVLTWESSLPARLGAAQGPGCRS
jgi:ATP-dependent exoDNAse (exonuclease V) beta subunit